MSVLKIKESTFVIDAPKASFMKRRGNALRAAKAHIKKRNDMDAILGIKRDKDFAVIPA